MKKLLLSTAAVAILSTSAFAVEQNSSTYLKGSLGMGFNKTNFTGTAADANTAITADATTNYGFSKGDLNTRGFAGEIAIGTMVSNDFGIEAMLDFKSSDKKNKIDATKAFTVGKYTFKLPLGTKPAAIVANDNNLAQTGKNAFFENVTATAKEKSFGLGGKAVYKYAIDEQFSLNAGLGAGVKQVSNELVYTGTATAYNASAAKEANVVATSIDLAHTIKAKSIIQPFGVASVGVDYNLGEGVSIGVEYSAKVSAKKTLEANAEITGVGTYTFDSGKFVTNVTPNPLATGTTTTLAASTTLAKGDDLNAKTGGFNQAVMATVKFAF